MHTKIELDLSMRRQSVRLEARHDVEITVRMLCWDPCEWEAGGNVAIVHGPQLAVSGRKIINTTGQDDDLAKPGHTIEI